MSNHHDPKRADYAVGYKKPPQDTRFKPGHKGNPRGRGKGTRNFATDFFEEGREPITVATGGRPARMSKQRAFIKQQWAAAFKGDRHASKLIMDTAIKLIAHMPADVEPTLSADDAAILERYLARQAAKKLAPTPETPTATPKEN